MPRRGFQINERALARMSDEFTRAWAKHPAKVPVEVEVKMNGGPYQLANVLLQAGALDEISAVRLRDLDLELDPEQIDPAWSLLHAEGYVDLTYSGNAYATGGGRQFVRSGGRFAGEEPGSVTNDFSGANFYASNIATGPGAGTEAAPPALWS